MIRIRLRQQGRRNYRTYRLVVAESCTRRDGPYKEMLGWYRPRTGEASIDTERVKHWLTHGAQLSDKAEKLITLHSKKCIST